MPLIQILSAKKQAAYEEVPQFSSQNRKRGTSNVRTETYAKEIVKVG